MWPSARHRHCGTNPPREHNQDVIDTFDMPTEYGSPIYARKQPARDASCIAMLREAGAVILGKTVTVELAAFHWARTRNPHDLERSPAGSSSMPARSRSATAGEEAARSSYPSRRARG